MSENATAAPSTQADTKQTSANIVDAIKAKANGKSTDPGKPEGNQNPGGTAQADPNAGKEKYVVDGKDIWLTPEQARAYTQKGISFEPKVDQLNRLNAETQLFLKTLSTDPLKILTDKRIGLTPEAVLEKIFDSDQISDAMKEKVGQWYYEKVVAPAKMTPEEREAAERDKKLSEYERQEKQRQEEAIKRENQARVDAAGAKLLSFVREAMKDSNLPDINTTLGALYAKRTLELHRAARGTITPKEAIAKVTEEMRAFSSHRYDAMNEEEIVKELGEKNAEKVKKYFLKLVKDSEKTPKNNFPSRGERSERKTKNMDDFHDYLDKLKRGESVA